MSALLKCFSVGEGGQQLGDPRPGVLEVKLRSAAREREPPGDVQESVTQPLGLGPTAPVSHVGQRGIIRSVISALRKRATNTTHLATDKGEPWCGTPIDRRLIPFEVRRPKEVNCDKCRRSQAFKMWAYVYETEGVDAADSVLPIARPPRIQPRRKQRRTKPEADT